MGINSTPFNIGLYNETSCGNAWPVLHRLASLPHLPTVYKGSSHPKHTPSLCRYMYRWLHIFLPTIELYQDSWPDDLKVSGYRPSQEKMKRCIFSRSCYFVYGLWLFAFDYYYFFLISIDFTLMNGISLYFPTYSFFLPLGFFFCQHFSAFLSDITDSVSTIISIFLRGCSNASFIWVSLCLVLLLHCVLKYFGMY